MIRLLRTLCLREKKLVLQNVKILSPMSQNASDLVKVLLEKKEDSDNGDKNIKNEKSIENQAITRGIMKEINASVENRTISPEHPIRIPPVSNRYSVGDAGKSDSFSILNSEEGIKIIYSLPAYKLVQCLRQLALTKQRSVGIIKAVCERLASCANTLSLKECADVLYCLTQLSFKDEVLFNKIANNIIQQKLDFNKGMLPIALLQSIGKLKYRNCELLNALLQVVLMHKNIRNEEEKLTALMTLATVNYLSPLGTALLNEMLEFSEKDFSSTKSYLDFVWACVLLDQYSEKHISVVLSEEFVSRLLFSERAYGSEICALKLLNINGAAQNLMKSYSGPYLNKRIVSRPPQSRSKAAFVKSVVDGLGHLYPKNKGIKMNHDTGAGFLLDVEFSLQNKPYFNSISDDHNSGNQQNLIGIILLDFNDVCIGENKTMVGLSAFKERILQAKKYKTIPLQYTEYNDSMKLFEKIQYLQKKFKDVLGN